MSLAADASQPEHTSDGRAGRADLAHPVRVLVVADTEIIVRGLVGLLAHSADRVEVLGPVGFGEDLGERLASTRAEVCLVDADRRGSLEMGLLAPVLSVAEGLKVVVFTHSADERPMFEALRAGAAGYLLKSLAAPELVGHLERARSGQVVIDPSLASVLALAVGRSRDLGGWPGARKGLSQRESDVLALLVDGLANKQIAERLYVGQETVKTHLSSMYRKLEVRDRAGAVGLALRDGIFS